MKRHISIMLVMVLMAVLLNGCSLGATKTDQGQGNKTTQPADRVWTNGFVYTADAQKTTAQAVAIKNGKIVFVGSDEDVKAFVGEGTDVVDLDKKMMMPSMFDGHAHGNEASNYLFACDLSGESTLAGYLEVIEAYLIANPDVTVVNGNGWSNTIFDARGPLKEDLDALCTKLGRDIPIALWDAGHHSLWVNSKALEIGGITKDTPVPEGSVIERDPMSLEPSGTLREKIAYLVMDQLPALSVEQCIAGIMAYQEMAHSYGFTGSFDAFLPVGSNPIEAYKQMVSSGDLKMYIRGGYVAKPEIDFKQQLKAFIKARPKDDAGELFQMKTIKFFADGVVEGATAYFSEPYAPGAGRAVDYRSKPIWAPEVLNNAFKMAEAADFQMHVHSVGDASTKMVLDAFAYADKASSKQDKRNGMTHLQVVDPSDIQRLSDLGIVVILNPYWAVKDDYYYNLQLPYLGQKRAEQEYPVKSFFEKGAVVVTGSDYPITFPPDPFQAMEIGLTRLIPEAILPFAVEDPTDLKHRETLWIGEAATLKEMLDSVSINGAYAYFLENVTGSIEVGKSADMVILSQNLTEIPVTEISNTKVLNTFFQGVEVYRAESLQK